MLQPHENITRMKFVSGDPILESPELSLLIGNMANELKRAYLFGGPQSHPKYEAMTQIKQGDLVVVTDQFHRRGSTLEDYHKAVGFLIEAREEWGSTDEEWNAAFEEPESGLTPEDRFIEPHAYYVQYDLNSVCRWVNCTLIKVPQTANQIL